MVFRPFPAPVSTGGRALIVVPLVLLGLWITITVTASAVLSRSRPDIAIRLDPTNSRALETAATLAVVKPEPKAVRRGIALATQALVASPLSSEGAAALGIGRTTLTPQADLHAVFDFSQALTRRTALTQIWFIEYAAAHGDIAGALRAYDHLFRVSDYYRAQFLPVLLAASAQPDVARGMARLLATRPPWRGEYFGGLLATYPGPGNFATLVSAMRLDPRDPDGQNRLTLAITRLIDSGSSALAYRLYAQALGNSVDPRLVRDGGFHRQPILPPFDWDLTESEELLAQIGTNEAGSAVLQLSNRGGRAGAFARQLLLLKPGTYRLAYVVGNVEGTVPDRPRMIVRCWGGEGAATPTSSVFPTAPENGRQVVVDFVIPAIGCAAQWLIVQAGNPVDAISNEQWLTDVRIMSTDRHFSAAPRARAPQAR